METCYCGRTIEITRIGIDICPGCDRATIVCSCEKLKRNYIGFEINKEYCEIAEKRHQRYVSQMVL